MAMIRNWPDCRMMLGLQIGASPRALDTLRNMIFQRRWSCCWSGLALMTVWLAVGS